MMYMGFEFKQINSGGSNYYAIYKDGERFSQMCFSTHCACRRAIDTFLKSDKK